MQKTDPRIIKTRRQIDEALLESLEQHPFQKITVDMICKSALINRSTFYKYYTDKYDLLDKYLDRVLSEFRQAMNSTDFILATPSTIDDRLYLENFRKSIEFIYKRKNTYRLLWDASIERNLFHEMTDIIHSNIIAKLREHRPCEAAAEQYQELYASLFASNMMTLVVWWFSHENTVNADTVCILMNSNMKNGLFSTFRQYVKN